MTTAKRPRFDVEKARRAIADITWTTADGGDAFAMSDRLVDACDEILRLRLQLAAADKLAESINNWQHHSGFYSHVIVALRTYLALRPAEKEKGT